ncbi:MAG TPA: DUF4126 domain-containing protein [Ktedonobacterales bacterium]
MPIDSTVTQPLTSQAILALVAALGLSSTAGLRAVATLFAIGAVSDLKINGSPLLVLNGGFKVLGDWRMLTLLGVLTVVEIIVDKFPGLDHVNDIIHTVIRPVVGAVIVAGTANSLSDTNVWVAAAVGAALAFGVHATKSTTRAATTAATAGVGNPVLSTGEDLLAVIAILLVVAGKAVAISISPWLGFALLVLVIILALSLVYAAWRITLGVVGLFRGSQSKPAAQASAVGAAPRGVND